MRVALVGKTGLVGSAIFELLSKKSAIDLIPLGRNELGNSKLDIKCDLLINANGSGNKTLCNKDPLLSFDLNCSSVLKYNKQIEAKRLILISSIDVYSGDNCTEDDICPNVKSNYSMHKFYAEQMSQLLYEDHTILRLPGLVGKGLKKNPVYDIINKRSLFIHPESELNFISTAEVAKVVELFLNSSKYRVYNVGATNSIKVSEIIKLCKLDEFYKIQNFDDLPLQKYIVNTDRLKNEFNCKTSQHYIKEYSEPINSM